jgi:hypothetical protein
MPRRGGRDRYRTPKQAVAHLEQLREKHPLLFPKRTGLEPIKQPGLPDGKTAREMVQKTYDAMMANGGLPPSRTGGGFPCRPHGVPWRECNLCSKPARRTT